MAKPILTVGVPMLTNEVQKEAKKKLKIECPDYHVILYRTNGNEIKFDVFYEKDHKPIDYEGLEKLILGTK